MNCKLAGISFADLPHIAKGEAVTVKREEGEAWDSDARPAYSIRLEGMHLGYVPLVETVKEEAMRGKDGFKKVWKSGFETMTKEELRAIASGSNQTFHEWSFVGKEKGKKIYSYKLMECEDIEAVRDWLYSEIIQHKATPRGKASAIYFDEVEGKNTSEVGEICSISVYFDIEGAHISDPLGSQTSASIEAERAMRADQS